MKHLILFCLCSCLASLTYGQIPNLQIEDSAGVHHNLPDFLKNDRFYCIAIWSTESPPSLSALNEYHNSYPTWNSTHNIEFVIICINDSIQSQVNTYANNQGWTYRLFFASYQEVFDALGTTALPTFYLVRTNHQILHTIEGFGQTSYIEGLITQMVSINPTLTDQTISDNVYAHNGSIYIKPERNSPECRVTISTFDGKLLYDQIHKEESILINSPHWITGQKLVVQVVNKDGKISRKVIIIH